MMLCIDRRLRLAIRGDESLSFCDESEVADVDNDVPGQLTLERGVLWMKEIQNYLSKHSVESVCFQTRRVTVVTNLLSIHL